MATQSTPCIQCGASLSIGSRIDRRFCSDKCKNDHHNVIKIENAQEIRQVLTILKRNRIILKSFLGEKPEFYVNRETLLKMGYDFDYHTHHLIAQTTKNEFIFSFNYGYRAMENNQFKIIKRW